MVESFAELLEESLANQQIKQGAILTAIVVDVNTDVVIVHAGLKSEAVIPTTQFLDDNGEIEVAVGDEVEVALDAVEDGFGETRLSREKAKRARTWRRLEESFQDAKVVTGTISGRVRRLPHLGREQAGCCRPGWHAAGARYFSSVGAEGVGNESRPDVDAAHREPG